MEVIEDYIDELNEWLHVNPANIGDKQRKLPAIRHSWTARLVRAKIKLRNIETKIDQTKIDNANQFKANQPTNLSHSALSRAMDQLPTIKCLKSEAEDQKLVIEFLERTSHNLDKMTWDFKNMVEIMKLEQL